uniref:Uncharacterized protein n=1 Tax=Lepeophtheirus salmonis TaxID=72036 RepID=A0A0K2T7W4_LEPSM
MGIRKIALGGSHKILSKCRLCRKKTENFKLSTLRNKTTIETQVYSA